MTEENDDVRTLEKAEYYFIYCFVWLRKMRQSLCLTFAIYIRIQDFTVKGNIFNIFFSFVDCPG